MFFQDHKSNRELFFIEWLKGHSHSLHIESQQPELFSGLYLSQESLRNSAPLICCCPDLEAAQALAQDISFFAPNLAVEILPGHEISPYSGLYQSNQDILQRLRWFSRLHFPSANQLLILTADSLLGPSIHPDVFLENCFEYKINDQLAENIHEVLTKLGYFPSSQVEDPGNYSVRGGIVDIFSPAHSLPIRIELFGDQIEAMKYFDPASQKSLEPTDRITIVPAREFLFHDESHNHVLNKIGKLNCDREQKDFWSQVLRKNHFVDGLEFFLPFAKPCSTIDHLSKNNILYFIKPVDCERAIQNKLSEWEKEASGENYIFPKPQDFFPELDFSRLKDFRRIVVDNFNYTEVFDDEDKKIIQSSSRSIAFPKGNTFKEKLHSMQLKIREWQKEKLTIVVSISSETHFNRIRNFLGEEEINSEYFESLSQLANKPVSNTVYFVNGHLFHSAIFPQESYVFLNYDSYFEIKPATVKKESVDFKKSISLIELNAGDFAIHSQHGICKYNGLKILSIDGVDSEFLELIFKDNEKLFLPIYRINQIQKYSGGASDLSLDKLGGTRWETARGKAKKRLREIAAELLRLYSQRQIATRPKYEVDNPEIINFESSFPYTETIDQAKAIADIKADLGSIKPMDRLVCGDVGFGKTEVAMRAIFIAASQGKQVGILAPTTILTFQHFETFKKRFATWPLKVGLLNRFTDKTEIKKYLTQLEAGTLDVIVGTHRLLSRDVKFKNLGLLIVDEEQKFGVTHKEKIRSLKENVDTLTLSATPIPRTLNMSLMGIRDLSIINTPPKDRLPTRTFLLKFNKETIRKNVLAEVQRGGQVFFLHNKVQSIYALADELKALLPEVKIAVGHGQMHEDDLENTLVDFMNKKIDVLVSTTIIESGMDIPNANTIFIDNAQNLGLSQLYQLRGRVGRGTHRAFCYLLVPPNKVLDKDAEERLRVLKENTALGSGLTIAQHDLELRGSGTILGEEQSGVIESVGYEMYMELLEDSIKELRGEQSLPRLEPDINLKIKALIPSVYIPDLRLRLSYYKKLSQIENESDIDGIEESLRDQFGKPPEEVLNLLGLMVVRLQAKKLRVKDINSGKEILTLAFLEDTPLSAQIILKLIGLPNKKYSITPDNRLKIRMKEVNWTNVYNELVHLLKFIEN